MAELLKPGVEVIQSIRTTSPTVVRPTLVPCVVGTAFEVLKVLNADGTINSKARYGLYGQIGKAISESSFPNPRGNIDELDVIEDSIRTYMLAGGVLTAMPLTNGSSFLATAHKSGRASMKTTVFGGGTGLALNGLTLTLSLDNAVAADLSPDIAITFAGSGNLSSAQAAAQINSACGKAVASVIYDNPADLTTDRVIISSPTYGAGSSLTVRPGSANSVLQIGYLASDTGHEGNHTERVEGYGFRGQDDGNNDTVTPWIEYFRGEYYLDGVATTAQSNPPAFRSVAGFIDLESKVFVTGRSSAITFAGGGPTIPLQVGDFVVCDGTRLKSGEVMKVETSRFKVGTINAALSTADSQGNYLTKVYDTQQVGVVGLDAAPFVPSYIYFIANDLDWSKAVATAANVTGTTVTPTAATVASVQTTGASSSPITLRGLTLHYLVTIDGVDTEGTFTFTADSYEDDADMGAQGATSALDKVALAIGSNIPGVAAASTTPGVSGGELKLSTAKTGASQKIKVFSDSTVVSVAGKLPFSTNQVAGTDTIYATLAGKTISFKLDKNPHTYAVLALSTSLEDLISEINKTVGATVATKSGNFLSLTSTLKGVASQVVVLSTTSAEIDLGMSTTEANGTGRPFPDAYLDDASVLNIGSQILRDQVTGYPLDPAFDSGSLYIQYRALRKDVSPVAKVAGILKLSDPDTLTSVLDPITEENPLGLGLFLAMLNAPTYEVKGLGIDEVTAASPEGTAEAWSRAAAMLETEEIYAIAPLTQDETIAGLLRTHVNVMSAPEMAGERIVFNNRAMPTRKNPTIAVSGTSANTTAVPNQVLLDTNPSPGLVAAGLNPALGFEVAQGVYLEIEVSGELRRYSVAGVTGSLVNLATTFAPGQNTDGFYSDVFLDETVVGSVYAVKVRGASLVVPGSNPARYDYQTMAETIADANASFKNRRDFEVCPDTVRVVVSGIEKALPGYYASACIVGMIAAQPPQQGFTNFPMTGITGVVGMEKFTKKQKDLIAGGGTYILDQDVVGGAVYCRHQLSTDLTSVETRELSITKVVDYVAKILRVGVRRFIGTSNVDPQVLDQIGVTVHAILKFLEDTGILIGSNLNNIVQDAANPDTVLIDVTLDVPYPCNYIRLTLVI